MYLDPQNKTFAAAAGEGQPLYEKSYPEARQFLEDLQSFKKAPDVDIEELNISVRGEDVKTVIFRPTVASKPDLPMIFYTHGGGWILGRYERAARVATENMESILTLI